MILRAMMGKADSDRKRAEARLSEIDSIQFRRATFFQEKSDCEHLTKLVLMSAENLGPRHEITLRHQYELREHLENLRKWNFRRRFEKMSREDWFQRAVDASKAQV